MSCASNRAGREPDVKELGFALDEVVRSHDVVTEFGGHKTPQKSTSSGLMSLGDSA